MLVMSRKPDEGVTVYAFDEKGRPVAIRFSIKEVDGVYSRVKIGVESPRSLLILRNELIQQVADGEATTNEEGE